MAFETELRELRLRTLQALEDHARDVRSGLAHDVPSATAPTISVPTGPSGGVAPGTHVGAGHTGVRVLREVGVQVDEDDEGDTRFGSSTMLTTVWRIRTPVSCGGGCRRKSHAAKLPRREQHR
jgi:hypothetical protein